MGFDQGLWFSERRNSVFVFIISAIEMSEWRCHGPLRPFMKNVTGNEKKKISMTRCNPDWLSFGSLFQTAVSSFDMKYTAGKLFYFRQLPFIAALTVLNLSYLLAVTELQRVALFPVRSDQQVSQFTQFSSQPRFVTSFSDVANNFICTKDKDLSDYHPVLEN